MRLCSSIVDVGDDLQVTNARYGRDARQFARQTRDKERALSLRVALVKSVFSICLLQIDW